MNSGIEVIAAERQRQIEKEGWDSKHDNKCNDDEQLTFAAICYATPRRLRGFSGIDVNTRLWPWALKWWKPSAVESTEGRIKELAKAGALIAAEIDRINNLK
ncbi:MAG: hypothetical protein H7282_04905 [Cytophagaceae bacterium]|nr:hypothetical protein [Cytophagaceae bacterium]